MRFSLNALKVDASVRAAQADRCQKCALSCSGSGFVNEAGARFQREAHTATLETEIAEAQDIAQSEAAAAKQLVEEAKLAELKAVQDAQSASAAQAAGLLEKASAAQERVRQAVAAQARAAQEAAAAQKTAADLQAKAAKGFKLPWCLSCVSFARSIRSIRSVGEIGEAIVEAEEGGGVIHLSLVPLYDVGKVCAIAKAAKPWVTTRLSNCFKLRRPSTRLTTFYFTHVIPVQGIAIRRHPSKDGMDNFRGVVPRCSRISVRLSERDWMDDGTSLDGQQSSEAAPFIFSVFTPDAASFKREKELLIANEKLTADVERLQQRLSFVEELVGPTETQRKNFQLQLSLAREAALRVAHSNAGSIPTRCVGRLDENWLRSKGLTDQECSMLQRGCVAGHDGVPCDISMLGDPGFCPYDRKTLQPRWEAKGGFLQLSLGDLREKWGEEVALEVVRCAIELDRHDASRRLGVELPWNEKEEREMDAAEVIGLLGQQLEAAKCAGTTERLVDDDEESEWEGFPRSEVLSPVDVGEGGRSRAWSMLEAMMNDLGLNPRSTSAMANAGQLSTVRSDQDHVEEPDTDDEVVQEALEEQGRAEAAAEQDIQQMLRESPAVILPPAQSQSKSSSRMNLLTPSRAHTPCSGMQTVSSNATRATSSSPGAFEAGRTEALSNEASPNEALFLQLLEDEVAGSLNHLNLMMPGSPETSRATSPLSSQPSP
ncbi:unnamed protein product [Symbiodinium natans]|uniref:Factor of DNA methylation 1-5/IDN2 domain-containing protein n=1 Tax=Symbiodinium natans TaxID=878477 RepID=A0A812NTW1_9DINO|nr:unnamed protein product [Symbiodinium natans]